MAVPTGPCEGETAVSVGAACVPPTATADQPATLLELVTKASNNPASPYGKDRNITFVAPLGVGAHLERWGVPRGSADDGPWRRITQSML